MVERLLAKEEVAGSSPVSRSKMFVTYVLRSIKTGRFYIGSTGNLERRLAEHNRGKSAFAKAHMPFDLIYIENFDFRSAAYKREMAIKAMKGGNSFRLLIGRMPR